MAQGWRKNGSTIEEEDSDRRCNDSNLLGCFRIL